MDLGLRDKVAIVTGSSRGIGRSIAMGLADEDCKLVICARGEEKLQETAKEIREKGVDKGGRKEAIVSVERGSLPERWVVYRDTRNKVQDGGAICVLLEIEDEKKKKCWLVCCFCLFGWWGGVVWFCLSVWLCGVW